MDSIPAHRKVASDAVRLMWLRLLAAGERTDDLGTFDVFDEAGTPSASGPRDARRRPRRLIDNSNDTLRTALAVGTSVPAGWSTRYQAVRIIDGPKAGASYFLVAGMLSIGKTGRVRWVVDD